MHGPPPYNSNYTQLRNERGNVLFLYLDRSITLFILIGILLGISAPAVPVHAKVAHHDTHHAKSAAHHHTEHSWSMPHDEHHHAHPDHIEPEEGEFRPVREDDGAIPVEDWGTQFKQIECIWYMAQFEPYWHVDSLCCLRTWIRA